MSFEPFDRMEQRVARDRGSSDGDYFGSLMAYGEFLTKLVVAGVIAAIDSDPDRHRYSQAHRLVRADGLGEWTQVLDAVLDGPASQFLMTEALAERTALTQKCKSGDWRHEAVSHLWDAVHVFDPDIDALPTKVALRHWFRLFVMLRNRRAHGAPTARFFAEAADPLHKSIVLVREKLDLFQRSWAYLHENLSGKYRASYLGSKSEVFRKLERQKPETHLPKGVYVDFGEPRLVELVRSDVDLTDFFCANGNFNDKASQYRTISYLSNEMRWASGSAYLASAAALPPAETQGQDLGYHGRCLGNLPPVHHMYIDRPALEEELYGSLQSDRHWTVTLHGRGGIGKTSLALKVLHRLSKDTRYDSILWFSARDIDLLPQGPKDVRPQVLSVHDIAAEYSRLYKQVGETSELKPIDLLTSALSQHDLGPTLFVFDNFETVAAPVELFAFLDDRIRHPNKILVTTRHHRHFKGDYPVEVNGMEEPESFLLIDATSSELGIRTLIDNDYRSRLHMESGGHPYVMKMVLGECARERVQKNPRVAADNDHILTALFQRSYRELSAPARRVFLTLCGWRSSVPLLGLQAVLLHPRNEHIDVDAALVELQRSSLIESTVSESDEEQFLDVPLAASLFGQNKLEADPFRSTVEADLDMLRTFGATMSTGVSVGIQPLIYRMAKHVSANPQKMHEYLPVLKYVASKCPETYLLLADLLEETDLVDRTQQSCEYLREYLENQSTTSKAKAWARLAKLCRRSGDAKGELHAWAAFADERRGCLDDASDAASEINRILREAHGVLDPEEKRILVKRVIAVLVAHVDVADATTLSRLTWLHLNLGLKEEAARYAQMGSERDPNNEHIRGLVEGLSRNARQAS